MSHKLLKKGKVRDVYEYGDNMVIIVTTDRISAFDHILPNVVPDRGKILNKICLFWADKLDVYHHIISDDHNQLPDEFQTDEFKDRTMMCERAQMVPFECVVRGYLSGSAWKEYKEKGTVNDQKMPAGMKENHPFPKPIFTPATKAETGHDINVPFSYMAESIGVNLASELEQRSLEIYSEAAEYCWQKGMILADTKFEWGILKHINDELVLADEFLTPDSSRLWPLDSYRVGGYIPSFDKQFVRDWLETTGWDKNSPPPVMPEEIINNTRNKYLEAYEKLTGVKCNV